MDLLKIPIKGASQTMPIVKVIGQKIVHLQNLSGVWNGGHCKWSQHCMNVTMCTKHAYTKQAAHCTPFAKLISAHPQWN